jgi:hypothetical protein
MENSALKLLEIGGIVAMPTLPSFVVDLVSSANSLRSSLQEEAKLFNALSTLVQQKLNANRADLIHAIELLVGLSHASRWGVSPASESLLYEGQNLLTRFGQVEADLAKLRSAITNKDVLALQEYIKIIGCADIPQCLVGSVLNEAKSALSGIMVHFKMNVSVLLKKAINAESKHLLEEALLEVEGLGLLEGVDMNALYPENTASGETGTLHPGSNAQRDYIPPESATGGDYIPPEVDYRLQIDSPTTEGSTSSVIDSQEILTQAKALLDRLNARQKVWQALEQAVNRGDTQTVIIELGELHKLGAYDQAPASAKEAEAFIARFRAGQVQMPRGVARGQHALVSESKAFPNSSDASAAQGKPASGDDAERKSERNRGIQGRLDSYKMSFTSKRTTTDGDLSYLKQQRQGSVSAIASQLVRPESRKGSEDMGDEIPDEDLSYLKQQRRGSVSVLASQIDKRANDLAAEQEKEAQYLKRLQNTRTLSYKLKKQDSWKQEQQTNRGSLDIRHSDIANEDIWHDRDSIVDGIVETTIKSYLPKEGGGKGIAGRGGGANDAATGADFIPPAALTVEDSVDTMPSTESVLPVDHIPPMDYIPPEANIGVDDFKTTTLAAYIDPLVADEGIADPMKNVTPKEEEDVSPTGASTLADAVRTDDGTDFIPTETGEANNSCDLVPKAAAVDREFLSATNQTMYACKEGGENEKAGSSSLVGDPDSRTEREQPNIPLSLDCKEGSFSPGLGLGLRLAQGQRGAHTPDRVGADDAYALSMHAADLPDASYAVPLQVDREMARKGDRIPLPTRDHIPLPAEELDDMLHTNKPWSPPDGGQFDSADAENDFTTTTANKSAKFMARLAEKNDPVLEKQIAEDIQDLISHMESVTVCDPALELVSEDADFNGEVKEKTIKAFGERGTSAAAAESCFSAAPLGPFTTLHPNSKLAVPPKTPPVAPSESGGTESSSKKSVDTPQESFEWRYCAETKSRQLVRTQVASTRGQFAKLQTIRRSVEANPDYGYSYDAIFAARSNFREGNCQGENDIEMEEELENADSDAEGLEEAEEDLNKHSLAAFISAGASSVRDLDDFVSAAGSRQARRGLPGLGQILAKAQGNTEIWGENAFWNILAMFDPSPSAQKTPERAARRSQKSAWSSASPQSRPYAMPHRMDSSAKQKQSLDRLDRIRRKVEAYRRHGVQKDRPSQDTVVPRNWRAVGADALQRLTAEEGPTNSFKAAQLGALSLQTTPLPAIDESAEEKRANMNRRMREEKLKLKLKRRLSAGLQTPETDASANAGTKSAAGAKESGLRDTVGGEEEQQKAQQEWLSKALNSRIETDRIFSGLEGQGGQGSEVDNSLLLEPRDMESAALQTARQKSAHDAAKSGTAEASSRGVPWYAVPFVALGLTE